MRAVWISIVTGLVALVTGCGNPCEAVCQNMADFARDCGYTVSAPDIEQCIVEQADVSAERRQICRDFGEGIVIQEAWDCLEVARYFPEQSAGTETAR